MMNVQDVTMDELNAIEDNYVIITMGHGDSILLPFAEGRKVFDLMQKAELYATPYNKPIHIGPIKDSLKFSFLSRTQYTEIKMLTLLNKDNDNDSE